MKIQKACLFLILIIMIATLSWIYSCTHNANIDNIPEICFDRDVLPIFQNNCSISGCHDGNGESDLTFKSYLDISSSVVAGNPVASRAYNAIITTWGENKMPPDKPLVLENRTIIRVWIEQGARLTVCKDGNTDVSTRACFTRDILPVLISHCATALCHDAITHKEGYIFTDYATTLNAVTSGSPGNSKLYQVIKIETGESKMPPSGSAQLSSAEIDSIGKWIAYGALNENCSEVCDTLNTITYSGTISPIIQSTCTGCHSGSSPSGNVFLGSYSNVASVASGGLLIKSLKGAGVTRMPPSGSFSACKIRQFEIWVNNGFLNN
jgi:hypothetical protein